MLLLQKDDELYMDVNELHYFHNKQWENNAIDEDVYKIFFYHLLLLLSQILFGLLLVENNVLN